MAKLLPVFLLAVFLTIFIASFLLKRGGAGAVVERRDSVQEVEVKKYWTVFLHKGPVPARDGAAAALIQEKHLNHIRQLAEAGKLLVAGPFGDAKELTGMFIMDCKDSLEVVSLIESDTAIVAGALGYEIRPWWTVKNCVFK